MVNNMPDLNNLLQNIMALKSSQFQGPQFQQQIDPFGQQPIMQQSNDPSRTIGGGSKGSGRGLGMIMSAVSGNKGGASEAISDQPTAPDAPAVGSGSTAIDNTMDNTQIGNTQDMSDPMRMYSNNNQGSGILQKIIGLIAKAK
jgi:hypothetical protein